MPWRTKKATASLTASPFSTSITAGSPRSVARAAVANQVKSASSAGACRYARSHSFFASFGLNRSATLTGKGWVRMLCKERSDLLRFVCS
jgi:hypothetical protein